jgi:predicted transcriptional regulator
MPSILGRFTKQPDEVLDYDVSYDDWFDGRTDTPSSFTVVAETGITIDSSARTGNVIRVVLSGGTNGESYKITTLLTTSDAIVKEADFVVKIKAI